MQIGVDGHAEARGAACGADSGRRRRTSPPSVYNAADAIYGAALYLAASGAPGDWQNAVFSYNHAGGTSSRSPLRGSYMGPSGLPMLASDIASFYGGQQPVLVGLTTHLDVLDGPTPDLDDRSDSTSASDERAERPGGSGDCGTVDAQGYANPWAQSQGLTPLRIDMGVDYTASGPIDAVGDGTITYSQAQGTGWGPYSCSGAAPARWWSS